MPSVSGTVIFDLDRSSNISSGDTGIANVPVVLQDIITGMALVVLSDANGNFIFHNVPNGNYRLVEAYGTTGGVPSPGNFTNATIQGVPTGQDPPISFATNAPYGATDLNSTTPNTLYLSVAGGDVINQNFFDGPVIYTSILPCVKTIGPNLITAGDNGTFGSYPPGTAVLTSPLTNPYPGIAPGFGYQQAGPGRPVDGNISIQNTTNYQYGAAWWYVSDHTTGIETGRMEVINGASPGAIMFTQVVNVTPFTNYLFSTWVLDLIKIVGLQVPFIGVQILDPQGNVLYFENLGDLVPVNPVQPEWKQVGTIINSGYNSQVTVQFVSLGPAATGNDFAIDDIALEPVTFPVYTPVKSVDTSTLPIGENVTYTVVVDNPCANTLLNIFLNDTMPDGLTFINGSVAINGVSSPTLNPETGFTIPDLAPGGVETITFKAHADSIPSPNPTLNNACIRYDFNPIRPGPLTPGAACSNLVPVLITQLDFGDAPDTGVGNGPNNYSTLLASNGPRHAITNNLTLGTQVTAESDAYQNGTATGDDISKGIQDDGVATPVTPIIIGQSNYSLQVSYVNDTGSPAFLYGWVDFNQDGIFELNESLPLTVLPSGSNAPQLVDVTFTVPSTSTINTVNETTFIRLRITTDTLVNSNVALTQEDTRSLGFASDGEVEDYIVSAISLSVTGTVWYDKNCNGIKEVGETSLSGVTVKLYSTENTSTPVAITSTDTNGNYSFTNLPSGNYYVVIETKTGYTYTLPNVSSGVLSNSNIDKITGESQSFQLNANNITKAINGGFCKCYRVAGQVFFDCNNNNSYDTTDPLLYDVTVILTNSLGQQVASTITDCDGYFEFNCVGSGDYSVQFIAPPGMSFVSQNSTAYYGSKAISSTGIAPITVATSDILNVFAGFTGGMGLILKYCVSCSDSCYECDSCNFSED